MKKSPQRLALFFSGVLGLFFFVPLVALAQQGSGHFVIVAQGLVSATSTDFNVNSGNATAEFGINIGSGRTGTTTGAFVSFTADFTTANPGQYPVDLKIEDQTAGGNCEYRGALQQHYPGATAQFEQLNFFSCTSPQNEAFVPADTYIVDITYGYTVANLTTQFVVEGAPINTTGWSVSYGVQGTDPVYPDFIPQFALVADGFQITPTAASSGYLLSGAGAFCNSQFGTSTGGVVGIVTDFPNAMCQVAGYLFIPTPESLQQFGQLQPILQQKIPFSYMYGVGGIFTGLTASTTENLPTMGISMPVMGTTTPLGNVIPTHIEFFSTTTISKYYPDNVRESFLFLGGAAIWVGAVLVVYRRVVPHKVL